MLKAFRLFRFSAKNFDVVAFAGFSHRAPKVTGNNKKATPQTLIPSTKISKGSSFYQIAFFDHES
jgi:hypothetical protein